MHFLPLPVPTLKPCLTDIFDARSLALFPPLSQCQILPPACMPIDHQSEPFPETLNDWLSPKHITSRRLTPMDADRKNSIRSALMLQPSTQPPSRSNMGAEWYSESCMDGVIVVNKPQNWTSHDVVNKMRRLAGTKKVGHLGTLDPLATGVLPLVIGKATRLAQFFLRVDKRYEALIRFGHSTDSYDAQGDLTSPHVNVELDRARLDPILDQLRGTILQHPPPVSAKKIAGVPAYKLARKHVVFELKPVEVTIFALEVIAMEKNALRIHVHCSGGTYVRSIAHDIGQKLGCGAFIEALERTSSGDFTSQHAYTLQQLEQLASAGEISKALIPAASLLPEFPAETVDAITATQIRQGRDFRVSPFRAKPEAKFVKAVSMDGDLVAIGEVKLPNLYHPVLVF